MTIAAVRPDDWNLPLLLHVGGAMVMVGALAAVLVVLAASRRGEGTGALRLAFRTLLLGAIPAYLVMRVGAEWVASEENVADDATWIGIGYMVADGGLLLLLIATVLTGLAARRGAGGGFARAAQVLTIVVIAGYAVALWAMTTKPG
jgi:hypothetical protein